MAESMAMKLTRRRFRFSKFFGYAAVTIVNGKTITKPRDFLYFILVFLIGTSFLIESIRQRDKLMKENYGIVDYGNFMTYIAMLVIALISMINAFIFRHKVWDSLLVLLEIDSKFIDIGMKEDYSKRGKIFVMTFSIIAIQLFPLSFFIFIIEGSMLKAFLYLYSGFYFILSVGQMVGSLNALNYRIMSIKKLLQTLVDEVRTVKEDPRRMKAIVSLIDIFEKVIRINESVNKCYGVPMLLGFGLIFAFTIFTNYMAIRNILDGQFDNITKASVIFCFYLHFFMYAVIYFCTVIGTEAHKIMRLITALIKKTKDEHETSMLLCLGTLVKSNIPKFSCGLFEFDWKMIYGVSLALCLRRFYILILIYR